MKSMTADMNTQQALAMIEIQSRLKYLKRRLANAERQKLAGAAQVIRAHIWGIEFAVEKLTSNG